jgi:hypothetical protein
MTVFLFLKLEYSIGQRFAKSDKIPHPLTPSPNSYIEEDLDFLFGKGELKKRGFDPSWTPRFILSPFCKEGLRGIFINSPS